MIIPEFLTKPEFYDIFGLGTFTYLTGLGIWMLFLKKKTFKYIGISLIIIGILGVVVDGTIVYQTFIK